MNIRSFHPLKDYQTVKKWWIAHNWPTIPLKSLSPQGLIVLTDDGTPVAAGWLYTCQRTNLGWYEYTVPNPEVSKETRAEGIKVLLAEIDNVAKSSGVEFIFSSSNHPSLINHLQSAGFNQTDTGMTHFIKKVI